MKAKLCIGAAILAVAFAAQAGEETANSEISGEIVGSCTFSVGSHDFGVASPSDAGTTKTQYIPFSINCSNGLRYVVAMDTAVPMEHIATHPGASPDPVSSSLTLTGNKLTLEKSGSPIGELSFWWDAERTQAVDSGTSTALRFGAGVEQSLAVLVDWKLPEASAFGTSSYGKWKVVNTYKVIF